MKDKIKIHFVSQAGPHLASHRMRVLKPVSLLNTQTDLIEATVGAHVDNNAHVNVFTKHFDQRANLLGIKSDLYKSVFDVCDNHLDGDNAKYYTDMLESADKIISNTENMKKAIFKHAGELSNVIPDPITFPFAEPVVSEKPRLLWFGHGSNLKSLLPWLDALSEARRVTVISNAQIDHPKVDFIPWKPNLVEALIKDFDIVLIPTDTSNEAHKCKSPNRAVDAIAAGKFVITDNKDIYGPLEKFVGFIGSPDKLNDVISSYEFNPEYHLENAKEAQAFIKEKFSDQVILEGWLEVLSDLKVIKGFKRND